MSLVPPTELPAILHVVLPELGLETMGRLSALHLPLAIGRWNERLLSGASTFRATLPASRRRDKLVGAELRSKALSRAAREHRDAGEGETETRDGLGARLGCGDAGCMDGGGACTGADNESTVGRAASDGRVVGEGADAEIGVGFGTAARGAVSNGAATAFTRHDRGSEDTRRVKAGSGGKSKSKKVLRTTSAMKNCVLINDSVDL